MSPFGYLLAGGTPLHARRRGARGGDPRRADPAVAGRGGVSGGAGRGCGEREGHGDEGGGGALRRLQRPAVPARHGHDRERPREGHAHPSPARRGRVRSGCRSRRQDPGGQGARAAARNGGGGRPGLHAAGLRAARPDADPRRPVRVRGAGVRPLAWPPLARRARDQPRDRAGVRRAGDPGRKAGAARRGGGLDGGGPHHHPARPWQGGEEPGGPARDRGEPDPHRAASR